MLKREPEPVAHGTITVSTAPTTATDWSACPIPFALVLGVAISELLPLRSSFCFLFFGFPIRPLERAPHEAGACSESVAEAYEGADAVGAELLVQPLPGKQAEQNADRELEADSSISASTFPVLLH